jgi:hypothetical protein
VPVLEEKFSAVSNLKRITYIGKGTPYISETPETNLPIEQDKQKPPKNPPSIDLWDTLMVWMAA